MRTLLLPCETRVREFDAKLLLACSAAAAGLVAVVGSKKVMDLNLDRYPAGVYVGKSVTARSRHNLRLARFCGHRLALWDEEGLVWASREVYWRTKVEGRTLAEPELLIAWGLENERAWREHPEYAGTPVVAAGNPRTDLLRAELAGYFSEQQQAIEAEYGPFLLINTNFSRVNHDQPAQNRHLRWLREQRPDDPRGGFAAHKYQLFQAFKTMVPALAKALPELNFVLRPHPSERHATWVELTAGLPNVRVCADGNVIPWLRASRGLIHNGCTTALEGFVMGRPALAYMPVRSDAYDHPLPNGLSRQVDDLDALIHHSASMFAEPEQAFAQQAAAGGAALLEQNLAGASGELACGRIIAALAPLLNQAPADASCENQPRPASFAPSAAARALMFGRRRWWSLAQHVPGHGNYRGYVGRMFPAVSVEEVRDRVAAFARCLPDLSGLEVRELQPSVFCLSRQEVAGLTGQAHSQQQESSSPVR
ncbi:MAG: surface carbohydrate biosynthesis protein [Pseudomonadales bacterium]